MRSHVRPLSSPHDAKSERPFQSSDRIFVILYRRYRAKRSVWLGYPQSKPTFRWTNRIDSSTLPLKTSPRFPTVLQYLYHS